MGQTRKEASQIYSSHLYDLACSFLFTIARIVMQDDFHVSVSHLMFQSYTSLVSVIFYSLSNVIPFKFLIHVSPSPFLSHCLQPTALPATTLSQGTSQMLLTSLLLQLK